jgi:ADP-heptose:LPS heptosyltransferase
VEWIVGKEQQADMKIHDGSLDMWEMAALFAEAYLAFVNSGFAPVLAQAVGTPSVVVYGGFECFATTHSHGARLTPTLPIDIDAPCSCFSQSCSRQCNKKIDQLSAVAKIFMFIPSVIKSRQPTMEELPA